ncbi:EamA family transporter, partial [Kitasatospora sp. NPDC051914]|uniref:EamA family transporter n=1 Tax=Kitasatospora sp. NPDC051914 TaxID=3154945 RepID=UPI00343DAC88
MTTSAPAHRATTAPAARPARPAGIITMTGSALSNQLGAATGALAFPVIGPAGVVAVRQWVAAVVLVAVGRPRLRSYTWQQWWPVLSLALVFATMNLTLYTAVSRIGLGLAVTLEFLGPLTVALAASRRARDLVCALVAGAAVLVLLRPEPTTDYLGLGLGLAAAACWAAYILLNRLIGTRLPGAEGSGAAAAVSGLLYVPVGVLVFADHRPTPPGLGLAAAGRVVWSGVPVQAHKLGGGPVPAPVVGGVMRRPT